LGDTLAGPFTSFCGGGGGGGTGAGTATTPWELSVMLPTPRETIVTRTITTATTSSIATMMKRRFPRMAPAARFPDALSYTTPVHSKESPQRLPPCG
jgi:hypothetical protein